MAVYSTYQIKTHPDIAFTVNYVIRFVKKPTDQDICNIKRIRRYLQGSKNLGIQYSRNKNSEIDELVTATQILWAIQLPEKV